MKGRSIPQHQTHAVMSHQAEVVILARLSLRPSLVNVCFTPSTTVHPCTSDLARSFSVHVTLQLSKTVPPCLSDFTVDVVVSDFTTSILLWTTLGNCGCAVTKLVLLVFWRKVPEGSALSFGDSQISFLRVTAYMLWRIYAIAILSVRLSHGWISQKHLKLGLCSFHHTVAPSL